MPDVTKPEPTESRRPGSRLDRWPQIVATILLVLLAADAVLGTNMQKFMTDTGEVLVGPAALSDTMKDLIVDSLAALVVVTVGYFSLRRSLASSAEPRLLDRDQFRVQRDD